jgi:rRNA processing protein Gar1
VKPLGTALHISKSGLLTVKAKNPPDIGSQAFVRGRLFVGTIIDVFGPVSSPYASVKLRRGLDPSQLKNAEISWEERRYQRGRGHHANGYNRNS